MDEIVQKFTGMGAQVEIRHRPRGDARQSRAFALGLTTTARPEAQWPTIDIKRVKGKEVFDIIVPSTVALKVLDLDGKGRHLLLGARRQGGDTAKYLCGHDERHWFVAAVPEGPTNRIRSVQMAQIALMPREVRDAVRKAGVKPQAQVRRRNRAFIRQGEWFFVPATPKPGFQTTVLYNEPINRGRGSTSHKCEYLCRQGGTQVWVHAILASTGIDEPTYRKMLQENPGSMGGWATMVRDAEVYVKGRISHPDHATVNLQGWHRVYLNNEVKAKHAAAIVFLD